MKRIPAHCPRARSSGVGIILNTRLVLSQLLFSGSSIFGLCAYQQWSDETSMFVHRVCPSSYRLQLCRRSRRALPGPVLVTSNCAPKGLQRPTGGGLTAKIAITQNESRRLESSYRRSVYPLGYPLLAVTPFLKLMCIDISITKEVNDKGSKMEVATQKRERCIDWTDNGNYFNQTFSV